MNTDIAEGKWTQVKGKLRESWGDLTDDEIEQTKGNAQQLVGLLQERYGLAKDQAEKEVEALTKQNAFCWIPLAPKTPKGVFFVKHEYFPDKACNLFMIIKVFKVGELSNPMNLFGLYTWHGYSTCLVSDIKSIRR